MKHLTVNQLSESLQKSIRSLSSEEILITEEGKPIALILNLGDTNIPIADLEAWSLKVSPGFWQMIDDRRTRPTIPLADLESEMGVAPEPDEDSLITYKGYQAVVEYDEDDEIFVGQIVNSQDVILLEGDSREALEQHFTEAIDRYLLEAEAALLKGHPTLFGEA